MRERRRDHLWWRCLECRSGQFAIIFAIAIPLLLTVAGSAIDYAFYSMTRSRAQAAADAAAIAGAKALTMADARSASVSAVVDAVVKNYLHNGVVRDAAQGLTVETETVAEPGEAMKVAVKIEGAITTLFARPFGFGSWSVSIEAKAMVIGTPNVCLLALDEASQGTLSLQKEAKVVGQNCAVYSNSKHPMGIKAFDSSLLSASLICSAGGKSGGQGNFTPDPLVDCPQFSDPLAGRPAPMAGPCVATNLVIDSQTTMLTPGTYCGGVQISGSSVVTFERGIYVMAGGPLTVAGSTEIKGTDVGFYFADQNASFSFGTDATIELTAPVDGIMAGLLFFGSRSQNAVSYSISSDHAHQLLGTIYLPGGVLTIDANQPIADRSAYTAIVARQVQANSGPTVMLNTRYEQTMVPVPEGVRGVGQGIALVK